MGEGVAGQCGSALFLANNTQFTTLGNEYCMSNSSLHHSIEGARATHSDNCD